jgi:hypothetical protein
VTSPRRAGASASTARRLVRTSRTIVRPGRKNGGTTLTFRLSRPAVLRFTIVRVYPTCKRVGSFTVRGHRGVNRVQFRGRLRGRPLPDGTYRLVVRPRGARADVAAVTVVIVNGKKMSAAELRRARSASVCRSDEVRVGSSSGEIAGSAGSDKDSGGRVEAIIDLAREPIVDATGALARKVREIPDRIGAALDDPFSDPFVLIIIGLLTLTTAALGTLVLVQLVRMSETDKTAR